MTKLLPSALIICSLLSSCPVLSQDKFANIGTREYANKTHLLVVPQPPVLPDIELDVVHNPSSVFKPVKEISTKEELYAELDKMRKEYEPFMSNMAPPLVSCRYQIPLSEFDWREETKSDVENFPSTLRGEGTWERVKIPHFGPPLGRAVTYYFKNVDLVKDDFSRGVLFICFKGIDYKASVFINGNYCGSHEGFFAPFEFEITRVAKVGLNTILVKVENDYTTTTTEDDKNNSIQGNKIYAASGPGYNDPIIGWHHCPPGMGIYQDCYLEARSSLHINDIFVRPQPDKSKAEAWIEVNNCKKYPEGIKLKISVYGQNFSGTVVEDREDAPSTTQIPGIGDLAKPTDWEHKTLKMGYGSNLIKIPIEMKNFRYWNTDTPWLYQIQVKVYDEMDSLTDTRVQQFGMRSFTMDTVNIPKGRMFLNGEMVRLRGANTMGHEQQCVIRKDWNQLRDDILLAKLCNMNYLRFTQRPVQSEVYDYCDMLGLMNQTDLPLFGSISRTQFAEAVKQGGEMERLVRRHPSTIMVTYINERFPNAEGFPQRSLSTPAEYNMLFTALDQSVLIANPDRVIKPGDGDYDPPAPGLPDNHCYNTWYNGHGLGLGEMYKGYWQQIKPNWLYACGEFGAEGLDPLNVMQKYYPKEWLPKSKEDEKNWTANRISMAQTQRFHYMWYNTQHSLNDWIEASQEYQAWAVKFVTETFRRNPGMVSFAVHLFIDAWPAGWMKSIMDVDRQPKKAYFAYRNALEPLMVSLRSDRSHFFAGEETAFEVWICNDLNSVPSEYMLKYQVEKEGKVVFANQVAANIPINSSHFQGFIRWKVPSVSSRTVYNLRVALVSETGESKFQNKFEFEVFQKPAQSKKKIFVIGSTDGKAEQLIQQSECRKASSMEAADVILIDDFAKYAEVVNQVNKMVNHGKTVIFLELKAQQYIIANTIVSVEKTSMGNYYFVSPKTGHPIVKDFKPLDFRFWYDGKKGLIEPILPYTFSATEWDPILSSGATGWVSDKGTVMAAGELKYGKGVFRICEVQLVDRINFNPTALVFLNSLLNN
jgi:hypothetical protein